MAITKLGHMKESRAGAPGKHLKNAIAYILNPVKTGNLSLIGGSAGTSVEEIYATFQATKDAYGKSDGRQGYHFIISFKQGEITEEQLYLFTENWCQRYLKDQYDYVYALHNDKTHLHAHVIFNSVCRTDGYKYHYKKGDWKSGIQPVTDQLCREMHLPVLEYDEWKKAGKSYPEWEACKKGYATQNDILRADIDAAIDRSLDYTDFLRNMRSMGYAIKEGISEKNGSYISIQSKEMGRAKRTFRLGEQYRVSEIKRRIEWKIPSGQTQKWERPPQVLWSRWKVTSFSAGQRSRRNRSSVYYVTGFQLFYIRRLYRASHIYNRRSVRNLEYRKDIRRINVLSENCHFLLRNHICGSEQLRQKKREAYKRLNDLQEDQKISWKKELTIIRRIERDIKMQERSAGLKSGFGEPKVERQLKRKQG